MSITLRPSESRGHANHGWLDTYHSFSFADYHDPKFMGFYDLRVINDDTLEAAGGFPTHGHDNMEIITYVVRGALAHKDTTGGQGVLKRGDVQTMSAGTGVRHSEFNASNSEDLRLLQIWVMPEKNGLAPSYAQIHVSDEDKHNKLRLVVAPHAEKGTLAIHQDVKLYASILSSGSSLSHSMTKGRKAWLQMVTGSLDLNGIKMKEGDGAAIEEATDLQMAAQKDSEFLLFDMVA